MTMISLNKDLPMPEKKNSTRGGGGIAPKYPFASMDVTNSFFVQGKKEGKMKHYLSTLMSKAGKKYKKRFILDEVPTGFNVFCIATGLGTATAKMYDFEQKAVIDFDDSPKVETAPTKATAPEPVKEEVVETPVATETPGSPDDLFK